MANYIKDLEKKLKELFLRYYEEDIPAKRFSEADYYLLSEYSEIVYKKYFSKAKQHHEDLILEGISGVFVLLQTKSYKPEMSATNFAFTKIRNCMTNYLYKIKESPTDELYLLENCVCSTSQNTLSRFTASYQVNNVIKDLTVSNSVKSYLYTYFLYDVIPPEQLSAFVTSGVVELSDIEYKLLGYYINLVEYLLMQDLDKELFENSIKDIVKVYSTKDPELQEMLGALPNHLVTKFLTIFSGVSIKIPKKAELKEIDDSISIYYFYKDKEISVEDLAKKYNRTEMQIVKTIAECENLLKDNILIEG